MQLKESELLDETYKLFGVCAHLCANIEYGLCLLLIPSVWGKRWDHLERQKGEIRRQLGNIDGMVRAHKRFDKALGIVEQDIDNLYKCSMGSLINKMKDRCLLTDEQVTCFEDVLKNRNYVIHELWGAYGRSMQDPQELKKMHYELLGYRDSFRATSDGLWEQARRGLPKDILDELE